MLFHHRYHFLPNRVHGREPFGKSREAGGTHTLPLTGRNKGVKKRMERDLELSKLLD